jgi:hypothetical protein
VAQGADLAALGDLCDDLFSNAANTDLSSGTRAFSNVVALRLSKIIDRAASPAAPAQSAEPGSSCDPADNCADCRCRYNTYAAPQAAQTERALTDEQIDRAIVAWFDDHGFEHDFGRRMRNAFLAAQPASGDDKC